MGMSVCPSRRFIGMGSSSFLKIWHCVRNPFEIMPDRAELLFHFFLLPKWGKCAKNGPIIKLLNLLKYLPLFFFEYVI